MANNNVIELVFKAKDQLTAQLGGLRGKLTEFADKSNESLGKVSTGASFATKAVIGLGIAIAAIGAASAAIHKTIDASKEAEDVLKKFDNAFYNIGSTAKKTREDIIKFADDASKTSIFDDEKILKAQTALLQFRSVSGETFGRARKDAIDLASAMGTDLVSAAELVGRSVERPEIAIRRLRMAGVIFTASQEKMIKSLSETGQKAKAADIILSELEKRFKGAGEAAAGTLSGALARLKTAYDNLFETDTGPLVQSLNSLTDLFNDPQFRTNLQTTVSILIDLVAQTVKWAGAAVEAGKAFLDASADFQARNRHQMIPDFDTGEFDPLVALNKELAEQQALVADLRAEHKKYANEGPYYLKDLNERISREDAYTKTLRQRINLLTASRGAELQANKSRAALDKAADSTILDIVAGKKGKDTSTVEDQAKALTEVVVKATKVATSQMVDFYDQLDQKTATTIQKEVKGFNEFNAQLDELFRYRKNLIDEEVSYGLISWKQANAEKLALVKDFNARYKEQLDKELEEVKVTVTREVVPIIQTPFDKMIASVSDALERMLNNGKFSFRELGSYLLREVESGAIKKALEALGSAFKKALSQQGSSSGGSSGIFAAVVNGIGNAIGGSGSGASRAGGGRLPRDGAWVGDDTSGPELLDHGMVYNASTLRGMMGSKSVSISSPLYVTIQGNTDDKTVTAFKQYVDAKNNQTQKLILKMLDRKGLKRPS